MIWLCLSPFLLRSDQVSWLWALLWAKLDGLEFLSLVATNKMITSLKTKVALFCFYVAMEHDLLAQEVVGISNPVLGIEGSVPHKRFIFVKPSGVVLYLHISNLECFETINLNLCLAN